MKSLIKHTMLRRYVNDNNLLPDFTKMFTLDEDGKPLFNLLSDFNTFGTSLEAVIVPFLKENKKMVAKLDKRQEKLDGDGGEDEYSDSSDDSSDTGDDNEDSGDVVEGEPTLDDEPNVDGEEPTENNEEEPAEDTDTKEDKVEGEPDLEGEPTLDS